MEPLCSAAGIVTRAAPELILAALQQLEDRQARESGLERAMCVIRVSMADFDTRRAAVAVGRAGGSADVCHDKAVSKVEGVPFEELSVTFIPFARRDVALQPGEPSAQ